MIDYFALVLVHGLLAIAFFRLVTQEALDREDAAETGASPAAGGEGEDA